MRYIHGVGEAVREALIGFLGPRIEYPTGAPAGKEKDTSEKAATRAAGDPS